MQKTTTIRKKTMYCDRSAYYQKAIKATARQLKIYSRLLWFFFAFWAISLAENSVTLFFIL